MRRARRISIILAVTSPESGSKTAPRYPKRDGVETRRALIVAPLLFAGCDPIIEIQGTFFPAWLLCMIVGVALTVALRPLFVRLGIEPFLGPLPLIYTSLAVLLTLGAWLLLFRT
jgi:YtcA-like protein